MLLQIRFGLSVCLGGCEAGTVFLLWFPLSPGRWWCCGSVMRPLPFMYPVEWRVLCSPGVWFQQTLRHSGFIVPLLRCAAVCWRALCVSWSRLLSMFVTKGEPCACWAMSRPFTVPAALEGPSVPSDSVDLLLQRLIGMEPYHIQNVIHALLAWPFFFSMFSRSVYLVASMNTSFILTEW